MVYKKLILPSLATLLLFNTSLCADETPSDEDVIIEEHVDVRSRETNLKKREFMRDLRSKQRDEEEMPVEESRLLRRASAKLSESSRQFQFAPRKSERLQINLASYYPVNSHWLTSIADNSLSIELEDGSHWEVSTSDAS